MGGRQRWRRKQTFSFGLLSETFALGVCNFFKATFNKLGRLVIDLVAEKTAKQKTRLVVYVFAFSFPKMFPMGRSNSDLKSPMLTFASIYDFYIAH